MPDPFVRVSEKTLICYNKFGIVIFYFKQITKLDFCHFIAIIVVTFCKKSKSCKYVLQLLLFFL